MVKGNQVVIAVRQKESEDLKEKTACGENLWMGGWMEVGEIRKL